MPVIIFVIGIVLSFPMYPIYMNSGFGFGPDAAYVYLFAAVDILQGLSPVFIGYPGLVILEGFPRSGRSVLLISLPYSHIDVFNRELIQQTSGQNLYKITGYVVARP